MHGEAVAAMTNTEECGLWGCSRTAKHQITVILIVGHKPREINICDYHYQMVRDSDPAYSLPAV